VEYATREQAQNAVATLSNQNLMGRLVYVREVRLVANQIRATQESNRHHRIERPSRDSIKPPGAEEATPAPWEPPALTAVATTQAWEEGAAAAAAAAVRFT